jgi:hypothetical protein
MADLDREVHRELINMPEKITFAEMGVRGILIYCSDYKCSRPSHARVENTVILPYVDVGEHVRLRNVVVDHGVKIPSDLVVGEDPELDSRRFRRTPNGV